MWRKQAIIEWSRWSNLGELPLIACEASEQLIVLTNGDDKSDLMISIAACCHRQTFLFNIWKKSDIRRRMTARSSSHPAQRNTSPKFQNLKPRSTNVQPFHWRLSGPFIETFMRAFRVASNNQFCCLVLTWHSVENLCSSQVVASGMDSTIAAILVVLLTILAQHGLSYCHITVMVEVAKPIIMANAVHQGLQGSYFSIRHLVQNPVRCTCSATMLSLSEMRCWWLAWNSEMHCFFQAIGLSELIRAEMIVQAVWEWRPSRLWNVNITILSLASGNYWMLWA